MLIHFLNDYSVVGRVGDRIKIKGMFPGIQENDYVYLNTDEDIDDEFHKRYRIEKIEYSLEDPAANFGAVIVRE